MSVLNNIEAINELPEDDQEAMISFPHSFIKRRKFEELIHE